MNTGEAVRAMATDPSVTSASVTSGRGASGRSTIAVIRTRGAR